MEEPPEFAPQYRRAEKLKLMLSMLVLGSFIIAFNQYWFFPELKQYGDRALCFNYGSFTGLHVLLYFVFVALPAVFFVSMFLLMGLREINVLKLGQHPLPGEKTFKPTRYVYGWRARMRSYIVMATLLFLLGLSVQGYFWAGELIESIQKDNPTPDCTTQK